MLNVELIMWDEPDESQNIRVPAYNNNNNNKKKQKWKDNMDKMAEELHTDLWLLIRQILAVQTLDTDRTKLRKNYPKSRKLLRNSSSYLGK